MRRKSGRIKMGERARDRERYIYREREERERDETRCDEDHTKPCQR